MINAFVCVPVCTRIFIQKSSYADSRSHMLANELTSFSMVNLLAPMLLNEYMHECNSIYAWTYLDLCMYLPSCLGPSSTILQTWITLHEINVTFVISENSCGSHIEVHCLKFIYLSD